METSRERVLKTINHIQPDTAPVHIMGFEETLTKLHTDPK